MPYSAIIVTHNNARHIQRCLQSLRVARPRPDQIVVVDNASSDRTRALLAQASDCTVITLDSNRGYAAAANLGASQAAAGTLFFLNPDSVVDPLAPAALIEAESREPGAIVGALCLDESGTRLQHVGARVHANGITSHIARGLPADSAPLEQAYDYIPGTAFMISNASWRRLGGYDERYWPLYFEDLDLCLRAAELHMPLRIARDARVRHIEGGSSYERRDSHLRPGTRFFLAYHTNRLRFVRKHYSIARLTLRFLPSELLWLARGGARGHLPSLIASYRAQFANHSRS